jgi:hypothetical protein
LSEYGKTNARVAKFVNDDIIIELYNNRT